MFEVMGPILAGKSGYARPVPFRTLAEALIRAMQAETLHSRDT